MFGLIKYYEIFSVSNHVIRPDTGRIWISYRLCKVLKYIVAQIMESDHDIEMDLWFFVSNGLHREKGSIGNLKMDQM